MIQTVSVQAFPLAKCQHIPVLRVPQMQTVVARLLSVTPLQIPVLNVWVQPIAGTQVWPVIRPRINVPHRVQAMEIVLNRYHIVMSQMGFVSNVLVTQTVLSVGKEPAPHNMFVLNVFRTHIAVAIPLTAIPPTIPVLLVPQMQTVVTRHSSVISRNISASQSAQTTAIVPRPHPIVMWQHKPVLSV